MKSLCFALFCAFFTPVAAIDAATTIWKGDVNADGTPSPIVKLKLGRKYQLLVSGSINLGKWRQQGEALENDACFEFGKNEIPSSHIETFKNSLNVSVCDGEYHPNHVYQSPPFLAAQNGIHFWIYDTNYEDNSGALQVEVIELEIPSNEDIPLTEKPH